MLNEPQVGRSSESATISASITGDVRSASSGSRRDGSRSAISSPLGGPRCPAGATVRLTVERPEAAGAVRAVARHPAGLADVAELLGQLEQPHLGADSLPISGHGRRSHDAEAECVTRPGAAGTPKARGGIAPATGWMDSRARGCACRRKSPCRGRHPWIVVGVPDRARMEGRDARLGQALGVLQGQMLPATVAMVYETAAADGLARVQGRLERAGHEARMGRARHAPPLLPRGVATAGLRIGVRAGPCGRREGPGLLSKTRRTPARSPASRRVQGVNHPGPRVLSPRTVRARVAPASCGVVPGSGRGLGGGAGAAHERLCALPRHRPELHRPDRRVRMGLGVGRLPPVEPRATRDGGIALEPGLHRGGDGLERIASRPAARLGRRRPRRRPVPNPPSPFSHAGRRPARRSSRAGSAPAVAAPLAGPVRGLRPRPAPTPGSGGAGLAEPAHRVERGVRRVRRVPPAPAARARARRGAARGVRGGGWRLRTRAPSRRLSARVKDGRRSTNRPPRPAEARPGLRGRDAPEAPAARPAAHEGAARAARRGPGRSRGSRPASGRARGSPSRARPWSSRR